MSKARTAPKDKSTKKAPAAKGPADKIAGKDHTAEEPASKAASRASAGGEQAADYAERPLPRRVKPDQAYWRTRTCRQHTVRSASSAAPKIEESSRTTSSRCPRDSTSSTNGFAR